ncbi:YqhG family protein [uncultured Paenibacillus sp.]|uniref:YqhG family protein n=1 Tax=uncultured Paenibacillus sp. TaxID=227322 RepID=UPI0028D2983B|nr:YqhG family protein [uncultured Paenibacillus sp.]
MNAKQVHKFVERYLEATGCAVLERSPAHFKVKLSPAADRALTNRPYYWSFVDRVGAEPETMSFLFVTDAAKYEEIEAVSVPPQQQQPGPDSVETGVNAALIRSFGHVNASAIGARMPRENLYYGSGRMNQLFDTVRQNGKFVYLFQQPDAKAAHPFDSAAYTPWLGINVKVGFECDRKREELHSYGVSLATGVCVDRFYDRLLGLRMTPRLPPNVHVAKSGLTLGKAAAIAEAALERRLKHYDYGWAEEAAARLADELRQLGAYYEPMLKHAEEEQREAISRQYENRKAEIVWQLQPRVTASVINCGVFHLAGIE